MGAMEVNPVGEGYRIPINRDTYKATLLSPNFGRRHDIRIGANDVDTRVLHLEIGAGPDDYISPSDWTGDAEIDSACQVDRVGPKPPTGGVVGASRHLTIVPPSDIPRVLQVAHASGSDNAVVAWSAELPDYDFPLKPAPGGVIASATGPNTSAIEYADYRSRIQELNDADGVPIEGSWREEFQFGIAHRLVHASDVMVYDVTATDTCSVEIEIDMFRSVNLPAVVFPGGPPAVFEMHYGRETVYRIA